MNIKSMQIIAYRFIQISKSTACHEHCLLCRNGTTAGNLHYIWFSKRAFILLINYLSILNLYIHLRHLISPFSCFLFMDILICCILEIFSRANKWLNQFINAIFFALFYILGLGGPLFYVMLTHSSAIWSKNYVVLSVLPALSNLPINFNFIFY